MEYLHKYAEELESLLAKVAKDQKLLHEFLFDLLTPEEYKDIAIRWQIVKQIKQDIPFRDIAKNLKVATATVSRGSRELMSKKGGFNLVYEKFYQK
ncbi:MAG: trp operon repressor [Patescibacteria group bacterium]|nr:trp operon repressor [Patescibacteria group bacterium]